MFPTDNLLSVGMVRRRKKQRKIKRSKLRHRALEVLKVINSRWPVTPIEVAKVLEPRRHSKTLYGKYLHNFRRLKKAGLINLKKTGRTYVAWPINTQSMKQLQRKL